MTWRDTQGGGYSGKLQTYARPMAGLPARAAIPICCLGSPVRQPDKTWEAAGAERQNNQQSTADRPAQVRVPARP